MEKELIELLAHMSPGMLLITAAGVLGFALFRWKGPAWVGALIAGVLMNQSVLLHVPVVSDQVYGLTQDYDGEAAKVQTQKRALLLKHENDVKAFHAQTESVVESYLLMEITEDAIFILRESRAARLEKIVEKQQAEVEALEQEISVIHKKKQREIALREKIVQFIMTGLAILLFLTSAIGMGLSNRWRFSQEAVVIGIGLLVFVGGLSMVAGWFGMELLIDPGANAGSRLALGLIFSAMVMFPAKGLLNQINLRQSTELDQSKNAKKEKRSASPADLPGLNSYGDWRHGIALGIWMYQIVLWAGIALLFPTVLIWATPQDFSQALTAQVFLRVGWVSGFIIAAALLTLVPVLTCRCFGKRLTTKWFPVITASLLILGGGANALGLNAWAMMVLCLLMGFLVLGIYQTASKPGKSQPDREDSKPRSDAARWPMQLVTLLLMAMIGSQLGHDITWAGVLVGILIFAVIRVVAGVLIGRVLLNGSSRDAIWLCMILMRGGAIPVGLLFMGQQAGLYGPQITSGMVITIAVLALITSVIHTWTGRR